MKLSLDEFMSTDTKQNKVDPDILESVKSVTATEPSDTKKGAAEEPKDLDGSPKPRKSRSKKSSTESKGDRVFTIKVDCDQELFLALSKVAAKETQETGHLVTITGLAKREIIKLSRRA